MAVSPFLTSLAGSPALSAINPALAASGTKPVQPAPAAQSANPFSAGANPYTQVLQAPVTATPNLGSRIGEDLGAGLLAGYQQGKAQQYVQQQQQAVLDQARQISEPFRKAIADNPNAPTALQNLAADPDAFAKAFGNDPASMVKLASPPIPAPDMRIITADSPEGQRAQMPAGTFMELTEQKDGNGQVVERKFGEVKKIPGAGEGGMFGAGAPGKVLEYLTTLAPKVSDGSATPEQRAIFETSAQEYTQPKQSAPDPVTGERTTIVPELPPDAKKAWDALQAQRNPQPAAPEPKQDFEPPPKAPGATLMDVAQDVTGLLHGAARIGYDTPILNAFVPEEVGKRVSQAGETANRIQSFVGRALRTNPRFTEGERSQIIDEMKFDPRLISTQQAYQARVQALWSVLDDKQKDSEALLASGQKLSAQQKRYEVDTIRDFKTAKSMLGRMTDNEADIPGIVGAMKPGQTMWFRKPDGTWTELAKPAEKPAEKPKKQKPSGATGDF